MQGKGEERPPLPDAELALAPESRRFLTSVLRHDRFRRLFAASTVSSFGDWVGIIAVTSLVSRVSAAPELAVGGALLARVLPGFLLAPLAGVVADKFERRKLMFTCDLLRALLTGLLPLAHTVWPLYLLFFLLEFLSLVWSAAKDSAIPATVPREELLPANQLSLLAAYAPMPLAGVVFALLARVAALLSALEPLHYLQTSQEAVALYVDAGTFLFSAWMVSGLGRLGRKEREVPRELRSPFGPLGQLFTLLARDGLLRGLYLGMGSAFLAGGAVASLGVVFVVKALRAGAAGWGLLVTSVGAGLAAGMALARAVSARLGRRRVFSGSLVVAGAALALVGISSDLLGALVLSFVLGFAAGVAWVTGYTLMQEAVPDEFRGRAFGAAYALVRAALLLSLAGAPLMAGLIGDHRLKVGGEVLDLSGARLTFLAAALVVGGGGSLSAGLLRRVLPGAGLRFPGVLIALEGIEGAGKSSQAARLARALASMGIPTVLTREPGGTALGGYIREVLLSPEMEGLSPRAEALLYAADRAEHVARVVKPALEEGKVVVSDRFLDSSLAYQAGARGLDEDDILRLSLWATEGISPDLVILLRVEPRRGLERSGREDRLEREDERFHRKVAEAYESLARRFPERFTVIDAGLEEEVVAVKVLDAALELLRRRGFGSEPPRG